MESIIASSIKSFLFSNGLISDLNLVSDQVTLLWICCFCSPNNGWKSSIPDMKSEPFPSTYHVLLTQSEMDLMKLGTLKSTFKLKTLRHHTKQHPNTTQRRLWGMEGLWDELSMREGSAFSFNLQNGHASVCAFIYFPHTHDTMESG